MLRTISERSRTTCTAMASGDSSIAVGASAAAYGLMSNTLGFQGESSHVPVVQAALPGNWDAAVGLCSPRAYLKTNRR